MTGVSPRSIELKYLIPTELEYFRAGFHHSIRYWSEFRSNEVHYKSWDSPPEQMPQQKLLTNLNPYTEYTVEIKMLSAAVSLNQIFKKVYLAQEMRDSASC